MAARRTKEEKTGETPFQGVETLLELSGLILDPANAREHGPESIRVLKDSLSLWGQPEAIVVQKSTNKVIAGNGRVTAARELGWTEIRANVVDLNNTEAAALALILNRSAEHSTWNDETVAKTIQALKADGFDVTKLGWDQPDLDAFMVSLGEPEPIQEPEAPSEFGSYGEEIPTEYCCPKCGYEWSGKPK